MKSIDKSVLVKALRKAKSDFNKGLRYYDDKHRTYNPAWKSANILEHVSDMVGLYGIEAYDPHDSNPSRPKYSYINSGDSYRLTLVYDHHAKRFKFTDIGTIIENEQADMVV